MMHRTFAVLALAAGVAAGVAAAPAAWAEVVNGSAAPKVPAYLARGATEIGNVGPLAASMQGKPVLVRIHADWCSACKATEATLDDVRQAYAGRVNFVQFDVTNAKTASASQEEAQKLGLIKLYDATKAATSTVAVVDPKDGRVYATLYNDNAAGDYRSVLDAALAADHS